MKQVNKKLLKISCLCVAGTALLTFNSEYSRAATVAAEEPVAGITVTLDKYYKSGDVAASSEITIAALESSVAAYDYNNLGIANVENHLNIRKGPGEDQSIIGKLPKDAGCTILDIDKNGWAKIKSGKVTGYVMSSYLITGDKAVKMAKKVGSLVATVNTDALNIRTEESLLSGVVTSVPRDEEMEVLEVGTDWVKVSIDADQGYVARQYIKLSYELKKAVTNEELTSGVSGVRASMVAFAKQYLGNPYVWGGDSLTNGVDCSGFTRAIYSHFGYSIPRVSRSQATIGTTISSSNVRPGDLVFYGSGSYINHVAMYIGNGQVIHASTPRTGIKISNMYYRTPIKAVRIISD
ncbi:MAG: N-acetylmuramoyl-L-alanine amidase, C-terminus [Anaerocolumna sp.]|jgi:cell wall-associated NlpC family hydrolase|nr:N-acetylmuramoyl-L-alanine amidase, C-terminus [Anaerocolumna sp.]